MTQIPIVSGIYSDNSPDYRTGFPVNMVPVPKVTGISEGYLRIADGIEQFATGIGVTRGGIEWLGIEYRVMGKKLVTVGADGTITEIGDVGGYGDVTMSYSFDYLAIASGGNLWLYDGTTLAQNVDPDLGEVLSVVWVDGYFMTTDGENLVVTELGKPFEVNPLKYGSSEVDPDPVKKVVKVRNEIYAVNRHTIEVFRNVAGELFPFQRIEGAQIHRGAIGTHCAVSYMAGVAFLGSGRNEAPSIRLGMNGADQKLSTREIDLILAEYTEAELSKALLEVRSDLGNETLIVHLDRHTLAFDGPASAAVGQPIWYFLSSDLDDGPWDARHMVWVNNVWSVGSKTTNNIGRLSRSTFSHWGETVAWGFGVPIIYNEGRGVQVHELELVSLPGGAAVIGDPVVSTEYSDDGLQWSQPKSRRVGKAGDRSHRIRWMRQGIIRNWRVQRFRGSSNAPLSVSRLEARLEPLAW